MKKWLILSLAFNLLIIGSIAYLALNWKDHLMPLANRMMALVHEQRNTMFEAMPTRDSAIIFLGNSITEGVHWSELFGRSDIINRGISGDMTNGLINRIDEIIRHKPAKLFIAIGTNDIGFGIPTNEIITNYQTILQKVQTASPRTKIFVQSVLPVGENVMLGHNNEGVLAVNQGLKKLCKSLNVTFVDLHPHFTDENGLLKSELTNDNLHLLGKGYLLWRDLLKEYVEG